MGGILDKGETVDEEREFRFTENDFVRLCALVCQHTGIALSPAKRNMVYSRLARRLRQLGLQSFEPYCTLLEEGDAGELVHFVNAITTNLTAFFREEHHFDALATELLPALIREKDHSRRLRIWSAGCSTGEEPYSIAIVLKETLPPAGGWDAKILATDLDTDVLQTGQRGIYSAERVHGISPQRLRRWFRKGTGPNAGLVRVVPALQELIVFRQLNLMHPWPMRYLFDIIFCRNVVIYFDKATQRVLFDRFADLLVAEGSLIIGHSESLFNVTDRFALVGKTIYRKCH
jgi:chemotaxis protein methyltransferase CheR